MGQRLIKQGKMYTDSGWQSWSLLKCEVTGAVSYTHLTLPTILRV